MSYMRRNKEQEICHAGASGRGECELENVPPAPHVTVSMNRR